VNSKFYTTNSLKVLAERLTCPNMALELIKYQSLVEQMKAHGRIAILATKDITLDMSQKILERVMCFLCLIPLLAST